MNQLEFSLSSVAFRPGDFELLETARNLLRSIGCAALAERVRVEWNARLRTTAGLACCTRSLVTLNTRLCDFGEAEVDKTLRHELAHLVAQFRAGRRRIAPHGPEWRQACHDLGIANETRCHTIPLPRRRVRAKLLYRCPSCRVEIKRVRPFRREVACLACCRAHNRGRYDDKFRLQKCSAPLHSHA